ncbi:MAG: hypothetical protein ACRCTA_03770 [Bacilli bacterium]
MFKSEIIISDSSFARRIWVGRIISKNLKKNNSINIILVFFKDLNEILNSFRIISEKNIYILYVDLDSETEILNLKSISRNDPFAKIFIVCKNTQNLGVLLRNNIPVLDYYEIDCPKDYKIKQIEHLCSYLS